MPPADMARSQDQDHADMVRKFVSAMDHVALAELPPDPKDYPNALPHMLKPASLVFIPSGHPVDLRVWTQWWTLKFGANWHRPFVPRSSLSGLNEHPVAHVAYRDAEGYVRWVGKELPTEAEFEFAARGGLKEAECAWGSELTPGGCRMANTWQGMFPSEILDTTATGTPRLSQHSRRTGMWSTT